MKNFKRTRSFSLRGTFLALALALPAVADAASTSCVIVPGENGRFALNDVRASGLSSLPDQAEILSVFDNANICIEDLARLTNSEIAQAAVEGREISKENLRQQMARLLKSRNVSNESAGKVLASTGDSVYNLAAARRKSFDQLLKMTKGDAENKARVLNQVVQARSLAKQLGLSEETPKKLGLSYFEKGSRPTTDDLAGDLLRVARESKIAIKDRVRFQLLVQTMHEISETVLPGGCQNASADSGTAKSTRAPQSMEDAKSE